MRETFPTKRKGDRLSHQHVNKLSATCRKVELMFPGPHTQSVHTGSILSQNYAKRPDKLYGVLQGTLIQNSSALVKLYIVNTGDEWELSENTLKVWANPFFDSSSVSLPSGTKVEFQFFDRYGKWIVTNAECD